MSEPRVIKKYPNRRLYDTAESRYITLADVRRLVVEHIDFVVIDKKNQQDITRSILLQVIAEQEHSAQPMLSREFLSQVIRNHAEHAHGVVSSYLEQSIRLFSAQQRDVLHPHAVAIVRGVRRAATGRPGQQVVDSGNVSQQASGYRPQAHVTQHGFLRAWR